MNDQDVITVEPDKRGGQPCIRGLRIFAVVAAQDDTVAWAE